MADTTQQRLERLARRRERQRRQTMARPIGPRFDGPGWPMDPPREWPDDLDGGAGVREPRHPYPAMPADAMALPEPTTPDPLDLASRA